MPGRLTMIGGALIIASGIINLAIALTFGAVWYEPAPNGLFGHVGIFAGLTAIVIGGSLAWFGRLDHKSPLQLVLAGVMTIVLDHLGAIAGALLVGTAGMLCDYAAGIWFLVLAVMIWTHHDRKSDQKMPSTLLCHPTSEHKRYPALPIQRCLHQR